MFYVPTLSIFYDLFHTITYELGRISKTHVGSLREEFTFIDPFSPVLHCAYSSHHSIKDYIDSYSQTSNGFFQSTVQIIKGFQGCNGELKVHD
jgi:hypothetical protein